MTCCWLLMGYVAITSIAAIVYVTTFAEEISERQKTDQKTDKR